MNYKQELAAMLARLTNFDVADMENLIETPPERNLGHFAFPCFRLAKELKKAPPMIAMDIAARINDEKPEWLGEAVATGPYVNVFLDKAHFAAHILSDVMVDGDCYGAGNIGAGKNVVIDYSSPNIAKPFHVGHLGSTIIGHSLDKIYRFLGYHVTSINYLGDWGTQFGKTIVAYQKWSNKDAVEKGGVNELAELYVKFHEEAEHDDSLNDAARAWVVKLQDGDEEGLALWRWFVDLSLVEYKKLYKRLNINFDVYGGESTYNGKMEATVELIREKGLLKESEGAQIVDLDAYKMPPCLILRSDGGTLYPTRDITAAIDRYEKYKFDLNLYVTGQEQILHFNQFFKVCELMGYPWAKGLVHIPYGLFRFETGKLSTRRGNVIRMEDLLDEAVAKTKAIIEEKNPNLENKNKVAEDVGIGALIFNKLYTNRIKDTVFNWELMLSFEGETGPYVQYTHARACSVLEKAGMDEDSDGMAIDANLLVDDEAFEVLFLIYGLPDKIIEASEKFEPFLIARQLIAIAQAYNAFYHKHVILVDDENTRSARLALTQCTAIILKLGLGLLGIAAPNKM